MPYPSHTRRHQSQQLLNSAAFEMLARFSPLKTGYSTVFLTMDPSGPRMSAVERSQRSTCLSCAETQGASDRKNADVVASKTMVRMIPPSASKRWQLLFAQSGKQRKAAAVPGM